MKKILALMTLSASLICSAATVINIYDMSPTGMPDVIIGDVQGMVSTDQITQTVTTNATDIPSGAAVTDALATETASRIADFETVSESIDFVAISRYTKDETDAAIENWTQAFVTNPVVQTVDAGDTNNVISGAAVKNALDGIEQKTEISTTNLTKLHVLEYPQQSNGGFGGTPTFYPTNYLTAIPKSFANIWRYVDATNAYTYIGTNKIFTTTWGAEVGSALAADDLLNVGAYYYTRVMRGGQPLDTFIPGTAMYTRMLTQVNMTKTNWSNAGIPDVVIWGQNEGGSTAGTYADYYSKATNLIAHMRTDLSNANLRVVFQGRNAFSWDSDWTNYVDQAMLQICKEDPLCTYMSERQFETGVDVHYTDNGQAGRGRATGGSIFGILRGLKFVKGFRTMEAWVDRFAATVGSFGEIRAGNAEIDARIKAGEAVIGGVIIENGSVKATSMIGSISDTTQVQSPWNCKLYLPFETPAITDPINGGTFNTSGTVSIVYSDTAKQAGAYWETLAIGTNFIQLATPLTITDRMTAAWWYQGYGTNALASEYTVLGKGEVTEDMFSVVMGGTANNAVTVNHRVNFYTNGYITLYRHSGMPAWDDGNLHSFVVAVNGTNANLYIDGILSTGTKSASAGWVNTPLSGLTATRIGHGRSPNGFSGMHGTLFSVQYFYDTEFSAADSASFHNRGLYGDSNIQGHR